MKKNSGVVWQLQRKTQPLGNLLYFTGDAPQLPSHVTSPALGVDVVPLLFLVGWFITCDRPRLLCSAMLNQQLLVTGGVEETEQ